MKNNHDYRSLDERLAALNEPRENCLYYAITLTADENLKVVFGTQTVWVGWADPQMRHELRKARLVYPQFCEIWKKLRQPYAFIHTVDEMTLFFLGGGNALVEKNIAEQILGNILNPDVSIPHGRAGFLGPGMFEPAALRRAPSPKVRMEVLNRDDRRCKICGRRPDDDVDLVLHVHHVRPWERGGVSDPSNLVTLCHTCHAGLNPHEDLSLFEHTTPRPADALEFFATEFEKGVVNYRKVGFFGDFTDANQKTSPRRGKRRRK